jgi:hypothetical protein
MNIILPKIINFNEAYKVPEYKWNKGRGLLEWGDKNNYPKYLLDLYNNFGDPIHKAIINKKIKMIAGQGLEDNTDNVAWDFAVKNNLEFEIKKAVTDYEIFNGFAFEVIYNREESGVASIQHIPFHKLRFGLECEEVPFEHFWFSHDWLKWRKEENQPIFIRNWNKNSKQGKVIYYYSEYNPQTDGFYPIPAYSTAMNWIELGHQISQFHLNQAKQGYSMSFILNFATGIPTEEEMEMFEKEFKRQFSGTEGAGKIVITWSEGSDGKPELTPVQLNDSDQRFLQLAEQLKEEIIMCAEIPPQLLLTIAGKLGSTDERPELMEEFQMAYVSPRQNVIEKALKDITGFDYILKKYTM